MKYTKEELITSSVLAQVMVERKRQDKKWGEQNHPHFKWMTILGEEVGEACKGTLEKDWLSYRAELIQVAAVAVAAIESLDRELVKATS